jgi:nucleoside-diphosphate-sugar epimerase
VSAVPAPDARTRYSSERADGNEDQAWPEFDADDSYNVSSGRPVANHEFVSAVNAAVPGAAASLPRGRHPGAPPEDPYLDITRLTRDTGFEPSFDVRAGVADYVAWLRGSPA